MIIYYRFIIIIIFYLNNGTLTLTDILKVLRIKPSLQSASQHFVMPSYTYEWLILKLTSQKINQCTAQQFRCLRQNLPVVNDKGSPDWGFPNQQFSDQKKDVNRTL